MLIMSIRPPENLRALIKKLAKEDGLTVNAFVIRALWDFVERRKKN